MMGRTILCFGDSNTYGYDPRSFLGDRYPTEDRWTDLLADTAEWTVINEGQNGREIPLNVYQCGALLSHLRQTNPDLLVVMLGSNDLFLYGDNTAEDVAQRMDLFLEMLPPLPTLLIAPVPLKTGAWITDPQPLLQSTQIADAYRSVAEHRGIFFADAGQWNIPLAYDGVHFTAEGHHHFAQQLHRLLLEIFQTY